MNEAEREMTNRMRAQVTETMRQMGIVVTEDEANLLAQFQYDNRLNLGNASLALVHRVIKWTAEKTQSR
jgi:hypothetical protein